MRKAEDIVEQLLPVCKVEPHLSVVGDFVTAQFGPAEESPWWIQRKMGTGSIWVAAALFIGLITCTIGLGYFAVMSVVMEFYPKALLIFPPIWIVMTIVTVVVARIKGITVEERRETIVWYPSFSLPVVATRRGRIAYGLLAVVLVVALTQQVYNAFNDNADPAAIIMIALGLLMSIVYMRPEGSSAVSEDLKPEDRSDGRRF